jgi:hypothetical protein
VAFYDYAGTQLDHEVESFDSATGELVAWVRLPSISASGTVIYMYYGDLSASARANPQGVWDSDFLAVYHFADVSGSTLVDSTSYGHDATAAGLGHASTHAGQCGTGAHFDGTDDYYDLVTDASFATFMTTGTLEAWLLPERFTVAEPWHIVFADPPRLEFAQFEHGLRTVFGTGPDTVLNDNVVAAGIWTQLTIHWDSSGAGVIGYADGNAGLTQSITTAGAPAPALRVGGRDAAFGENLLGTLDELRISRIERSPEWIATTYANQRDPQSFVRRGAAESQP